jgi:D-glycero-alpha-D-manno-heptose-7-phosphate kinase
MSEKISYPAVDQLYEHVKGDFGVLGGKIIGAGGGGFLMLYCPQNKQALTHFMQTQGYLRLPYQIEFEGSKVVSNLQNSQELGRDTL